MKVVHFLDIEPVAGAGPGVLKREVITGADGAPNMQLRVFDVEPGCSSRSHSHPWEHETFILEGTGVVESDRGDIPFSEGTVLYIPPNEHHCLHNTGDGLLRFICLIPVGVSG